MGISCTPHLHHCSAEFVIASTRDPLNADVREPTHTAAAFEAQNDPLKTDELQKYKEKLAAALFMMGHFRLPDRVLAGRKIPA